MSSHSKLINTMEDVLQMNTKLQQSGYQSTFDIIKMSRDEFAQKHRHDFKQQAASVYDLAAGFSQQVNRIFKKKSVMNMPGQRDNPGGIQKSGPTWQSLFDENWAAYCLKSAPEANDSPVSYLAWLYTQSLAWENSTENTADIFKLAVRRPDLPVLFINDNAINQVVPSLDIVNNILATAIMTIAGDDADKTLATTRYPNSLPYTFPQQQTLLSLAQCQLNLTDMIAEMDIAWPYFLAVTSNTGLRQIAWEMGGELAPEQYQILQDLPVDPASLPTFYMTNFGINADSYSVFEPLTVFSQQAALTVREVEELIAGTAGGYNVTVSPNYLSPSAPATPTPNNYGAVFINNGVDPIVITSSTDPELANLSDDRMDRINRLIRLQKWLALPYSQVDLLVTATMNAEENTLRVMNDNTLRMLGIFKYYSKSYGTTPAQFAAIINEITPYAIAPEVPFIDQLFNSPSLFEEPFEITDEQFDYTDPTERVVKQLCAGLGINEVQFRFLADQICASLTRPACEPGEGMTMLPCSLAIVSAFYRLVKLPELLGLNFDNGIALMQLIDKTLLPQLAAIPFISPAETPATDILDTLMAMSDACTWLRQHNLSPSLLLALITLDNTEEQPKYTTAAQFNLIADINQQLVSSLLSETILETCGVPNETAGGESINWMDTLSSLIDANGIILPVVTSADETVYNALYTEIDTVIGSIDFNSPLSDDEIDAILTNLIYQTKLSQDGIANSSIAKNYTLAQGLPPFLLTWANSSSWQFLSQCWALKDISDPQDPGILAFLSLMLKLGCRAEMTREFTLTPAMLNAYLTWPAWFGVNDNTINLRTFYQFSRYADAMMVITTDEDALLAYLKWVNGSSAVTAISAAKALAKLLGWEASEVQLAVNHIAPITPEPESETDSIATTLTHIDGVMRLQNLAEQSGLCVEILLQVGALNPDSDYETWQPVGESLVAVQGTAS